MKQALKNVDASTPVQHNTETSVTSPKVDVATTQEANVLNLNQAKNLSRFLEASCDCC